MKKLLIVTTAVLALGTSVACADGSPGSYRPAAKSCAQFGGGYVGINGGWAYQDKTWVDRDAWVDNFSVDWALGSVNGQRSGGTAGAQAGYNWQPRCTVLGVEIDANWAGLSESNAYSPVAGPGTVLTLEDRVNWFGTARLRGGLVVDNLMLYVTGGLAFANVRHNFTVNDPAATESFSADRTRWGVVGGVGAELAWTNKWSVKAESLYHQFSEVSSSGFSANGAQTVHFDNQDSIWVTRIGLNYRWAPR